MPTQAAQLKAKELHRRLYMSFPGLFGVHAVDMKSIHLFLRAIGRPSKRVKTFTVSFQQDVDRLEELDSYFLELAEDGE
jgi:hypothetical protein